MAKLAQVRGKFASWFPRGLNQVSDSFQPTVTSTGVEGVVRGQQRCSLSSFYLQDGAYLRAGPRSKPTENPAFHVETLED